MHPVYQLINIDTWILYHYKDCDNTFKESEHIRRQFLQSFDLFLFSENYWSTIFLFRLAMIQVKISRHLTNIYLYLHQLPVG